MTKPSSPDQVRLRLVGPTAGGAKLLDELHAAFLRYVAFPSAEAADAVTLWTAASHGVPAWHCAPRLGITSPEKRCGKTRLLEIVKCTCHHPLPTGNISAAALARSMSDDPPTLLLDEADTVFGKGIKDERSEVLRGLIDQGHQRGWPYTRWDAGTRTLEECPTFGMVAVAAIGSLPDTITDRGVMAQMQRRAPGEAVARFRDRRDGTVLRDLGDRLGAWVRAHLHELEHAEPEMPLDDRAADTWEPLIAIADLADGDWPDRSRHAARTLAGVDDMEIKLPARLLADMRDAFEGASALHTQMILDRLYKIDEAPWTSYYGRMLTDRDLAVLLGTYRIKSCDVKLGGITRKGYRTDRGLHDAWTRYLPGGSGATSATSATSQVSGHDPSATQGLPPLPFEPEEPPPLFQPADAEVLPPLSFQPGGSGGSPEVAPGIPPLTSPVAEVAEVADTQPESGQAEFCEFGAGSLYCVKSDCRNPNHKKQP